MTLEYARPAVVCSLIRAIDQVIEPGPVYTIVRFPFGATESYDEHGMHQVQQPDGYAITNWDADARSGLVWPSRSGWGALTVDLHWEAGGYTELRDQFVRDPFGWTNDPENTTGTEHRPPSPGMQCWSKHHEIFVHPDTALAVRVAHNDSVPRRLVHAQFKLAIHDV